MMSRFSKSVSSILGLELPTDPRWVELVKATIQRMFLC